MTPRTQPPTLNLVFFGDSLTEGVPHFNGETDTMPFMVNQQFPGATYIKLGYRGQTSGYLREKFDGWLCAQYKADMENVLVLWTGTNDLALNKPPSNFAAITASAHPIRCPRPPRQAIIEGARRVPGRKRRKDR